MHALAFSMETESPTNVDVLRELLSAAFRAADYRPPLLPDLALKIVNFASSDADTTALVTLIERDPLIAARVIQVANSPLYGTRASASIHDATVRLGRRTIVQIVMEVALQSAVFSVKSYQASVQRVFDHSLATAHLAKLVAKTCGVVDDSIYLCGLLHDIGTIGALGVLSELEGKCPPLNLDLWMAIDDIHCAGSGIIAGHWSLPTGITAVIQSHHRINPDPEYVVPTAVVTLAETLASNHGLGACEVFGVDSTPELTVIRCRDTLALDDKKWNTLQKEAELMIELLKD